MSEERPELSKNWRISGKLFQTLANTESVQIKVPEYLLALVTWLISYNFVYFGSFTEFGVMSEERPELSRKYQISGKLFYTLDNAKNV